MLTVDLRSDTVTRPTAGMRDAMMSAPLGDDVLGDDPTVRRLEGEMAELVGKESALFVPSGTMANLLATMVSTRPGDAVLMHRSAHPFNYEAAGAAAVAGVQILPLEGERGFLAPATIGAAIKPVDPHFAPATLMCVEDTTNRGGGAVHPLGLLQSLCEAATRHDLSAHMDGARAWHSAVATGESLALRSAGFDTASFCFSKGLGAPVGSVLCGPADRIAHALRLRKMLGGGMRQSGLLAAAALYAMEHHVQRLADDHRRARRLAEALEDLGFKVASPETNMVYVTVSDGPEWQAALERRGIRCLHVSGTELRLVFHLDVDDHGTAATIDAFKAIQSDSPA